MSPSCYQKIPQTREVYLAYVVAIRDPLNYHLDIYWPSHIESRYSSALHYEYTFVSEELNSGELNSEPELNSRLYCRNAYSCHLRGIEIISKSLNDFTNMKEAYITMSKRIAHTGGWVLVSVSDIDVYRRILVNIFDVLTRHSFNTELLHTVSTRTGEHIVREYIRPVRTKPMFQPGNVPKDYHIIFDGSGKSPRKES